jgi:SPW repeat
VSAGLGIWLLAAPAVFGTQGAIADSSHVVGALVVTIAATAMAEVTRAARFLNALLGAWVALAPWLLSGALPAARWHDALVGAALILLSLPRGRVRERYGTWQRYAFQASPATARSAP